MRALIALSLLAASAAQAQDAQPARVDDGIEEVVVRAHPLSAQGLAQASLVVEGEELRRNMSVAIGETLARQPGIHNASFGPAAGRPVVRGLSGPRVRVMEDRLDTLDVSVTSVDHATTVDPLVADRIEVLKGASTLVYGSGAIGGVVDVHTGRIPNQRRESLSGGIEARAENSTEQVSTVGELDFGAGPVAFHVDGFRRDANEYDIPGCVESSEQRGAEGGEPCEQSGTLPGSELETSGGAFGTSYVGKRGFVGFAVSRYDSEYGLPGAHGHGEHGEGGEHGEDEEQGQHGEGEDEEGTPTLDLEQTRYELEAGYEDPLPGFSSIALRAVYNDYQHEEVEASGAGGTEFDNEAWDTRLEFRHRKALGFEGTIGLQYSYKEFSALGDEAFVDPVDTTLLAAFWVGERDFSNFQLETGLRFETVEHEPDPLRDLDLNGEDFTMLSASIGFVVPFGHGLTAGLVADYSERAPVAEELYSFGAHLATQSFEIGDPSLDEEQALNVAVTLSYSSARFRLDASAYYTSFSDFIYEFATGDEDEESGLPILQFTQEDADFYGLDLSAAVRVATFNQGELWLNGLFDYVDAELDVSASDNVPRLAPLRVGVGAEGTWKAFTARVDYLYVDDQDDTTEFELPTDDYEDLRIYVGASVPVNFGSLWLFVQGKNLTDDEQRYHTSFIKDFAPQPGRTVEAGVRMTF